MTSGAIGSTLSRPGFGKANSGREGVVNYKYLKTKSDTMLFGLPGLIWCRIARWGYVIIATPGNYRRPLAIVARSGESYVLIPA